MVQRPHAVRRLADLDLAYDLTTYEKKTNHDAAAIVGERIEGGTMNRAGLRALLAAVTEPDALDDDESPKEDKDQTPADFTVTLTATEHETLIHALNAYTPLPAELADTLRLRIKIGR